MRLKTPGTNTSGVEVLNVSENGMWLLVKGREYFLDHDHFPWFKEVKVSDIFEVELLHDTHLFWPALDVDLEIKSLEYPERYPLIYR